MPWSYIQCTAYAIRQKLKLLPPSSSNVRSTQVTESLRTATWATQSPAQGAQLKEGELINQTEEPKEKSNRTRIGENLVAKDETIREIMLCVNVTSSKTCRNFGKRLAG
ncbi:hypothetical protein XENORESO_016169 [Xenotaenia resolanae]|uniref:Transposase n=1 Tax=Xenotaenia resolanae TaxID=208358 RepID=A0ABV0VT71_9TELE